MAAVDPLSGLLETAVALVRGTTSARLALAGLSPHLHPALLPEELRAPVLDAVDAAVAEACVPLPRRDVERTLRSAWGAKPGEELDELDLDAQVALTPTSVVLRGVLEGAPVAVKVLRPGLPEVVRSDLRLLDVLAPALGALFPRLDVGALVREIRERTAEELDLEHEADVQRRFARALRGHPTLTVPAPVTRLSHERVLVAAWADGIPVLEAPESERERVARALVAFHVGSARFGTLHADPAPGHALLQDDGRVAFLDAGATRRLAPERVELAVAALDALAGDDAQSFARALERLGWLAPPDAQRAHALGRHVLAGLLDGPALLDVATLAGMRDRALERVEEALDLATRAALAAEDLLALRMLGALVGLLARLGVEADWVALVRAAATEGWQA